MAEALKLAQEVVASLEKQVSDLTHAKDTLEGELQHGKTASAKQPFRHWNNKSAA